VVPAFFAEDNMTTSAFQVTPQGVEKHYQAPPNPVKGYLWPGIAAWRTDLALISQIDTN
jgi:hypothetical protein